MSATDGFSQADSKGGVDATKVARIKAAMIEYFERCPRGVSFVNLRDAVGDTDARGDYAVTNDKCNALNIIWWIGVSLEFNTALGELRHAGFIEMHPSSLLVYLIDGCVLQMPLIKGRVPRKRYKELHWAPVVFNRVGA